MYSSALRISANSAMSRRPALCISSLAEAVSFERRLLAEYHAADAAETPEPAPARWDKSISEGSRPAIVAENAVVGKAANVEVAIRPECHTEGSG